MSATQLSPIAQFSGFMDKMKGQMALALPKHLSADRMARLALTAFSTNPGLQKCTHQSIAASIMTAVQLGLEPNVNGAGYLIPYKDTCTFVPGWKGLVDLVGRSGRGTVFTGVIFDDQIQGVDWEYLDGSRRELIILKQSSLSDETKITHAYAVGWVKDAAMPIIELWSVDKLKNHRNKQNKVGSKHYSFKYWEMYCRKIPLLQVIKYMPCSIELAMAVDVANVTEFGGIANIENGIVSTQYQQERADYKTVHEPKNVKTVTDLLSEKEQAELEVDDTTGEMIPQRDYTDLLMVISECESLADLSRIVHDWSEADKRNRDADNLLSSLKSAIDGIADELVIDDNRFVFHPYLRDKILKYGKVTITITSDPEDKCNGNS